MPRPTARSRQPSKRATVHKRDWTAWWRHPLFPLLLGITGITIFFLWLTVTFGPIVWIELRYRVQRTLGPIFPQGSTLRSLIIPDLSIDLRGQTDSPNNAIVIPKIYLDEPVVYNVNPNDREAYLTALKEGIAHASSTSFPDQGGLGYYFAHSSHPEFRSQFNAVFYLLGKLERGDTVFLWHEGERFEYAVTDTVTVDPNDTYFLYQEYPRETVVLQTCWPPGTTSQRKLVFAQRVTE